MGNKQPGPNSNMIIQIWGFGTGGKERRLTHRLEVRMIWKRWSTWRLGQKEQLHDRHILLFDRASLKENFHDFILQTAENTEVVAVRARGLGPMADGRFPCWCENPLSMWPQTGSLEVKVGWICDPEHFVLLHPWQWSPAQLTQGSSFSLSFFTSLSHTQKHSSIET